MNPLSLIKQGLLAAGHNFDRNAAGDLPSIMGSDFTPDVRRRARANAIMAIGQSLAGQKPMAEGLRGGQEAMLQGWAAKQQIAQQRRAQEAMAQVQGMMAQDSSQPTAAPSPGALRARAEQYYRIGDALNMAGRDKQASPYFDRAKLFLEQAAALEPKPVDAPMTVAGPDGKPMLVQRYNDGSMKPVQGYSPAPDNVMVDTGGGIQFVNKNAPPAAPIAKGPTPDAQMVDKRTREQFALTLPLEERRVRAAEQGAQAARAAAANGLADRGMRAENDLRGEYMKGAQSYIGMRDAWGKIQAATEKPSAAGDVALIYGFMRILDPGSTVREGEFATAANAGGIPDQVRATYNKALTGERLSDAIRADFVGQAQKLYEQSVSNYGKLRQQYTGLSSRYGLRPENVVVDLSPTAMPKITITERK